MLLAKGTDHLKALAGRLKFAAASRKSMAAVWQAATSGAISGYR
jgi:hypothetical protein